MKEIIELSEKSITLERNKFLTTIGNIDTNVYYIESGSLRVFVLDDDEEQTIRFGYKDNLIVVLDSYLTGKPSNIYIQALKKTVVKVISKQKMDVFLELEVNKNWWLKILESLVLQRKHPLNYTF